MATKGARAGASYAQRDAANKENNVAYAWHRYKATQDGVPTKATQRAFGNAYKAGQKRYSIKSNPQAQIPRGKWINGKIRVTKSGKIEAMVPRSAVKR